MLDESLFDDLSRPASPAKQPRREDKQRPLFTPEKKTRLVTKEEKEHYECMQRLKFRFKG